MVRKFCDICGEEIHEPWPMANVCNMVLPMYRLQQYQRTLGMALQLVDVDLCPACNLLLEKYLGKMREDIKNAAAGADGHSGRGEDPALL